MVVNIFPHDSSLKNNFFTLKKRLTSNEFTDLVILSKRTHHNYYLIIIKDNYFRKGNFMLEKFNKVSCIFVLILNIWLLFRNRKNMKFGIGISTKNTKVNMFFCVKN